jgi:hypothetical protein
VVGISDYPPLGYTSAQKEDLNWCDEDATDWYNYLVDKGYKDANIKVLTDGGGTGSTYPKDDGKATKANLKAALNNLVTTAGPDDTITFATSGHGYGNGQGSSMLNLVDGKAIYDTELAEIFAKATAKRIFIFIDHCFSGGLGPEFMALSNKDHIYLTTTCTEKGYGYDDSNHHNGMWTYWYLEGGLINHFGGDLTASETCFTWAASKYFKKPPSGDAPMQFDGNQNEDFYFWDEAAKTKFYINYANPADVENATLNSVLPDSGKCVISNKNFMGRAILSKSETAKIKTALNMDQKIKTRGAKCWFSHIIEFYDKNDSPAGQIGVCESPAPSDNLPAVFIPYGTSKRLGITIPDGEAIIRLLGE